MRGFGGGFDSSGCLVRKMTKEFFPSLPCRLCRRMSRFGSCISTVICVWSDKGTVHLFNLVVFGASNRQSTFSPLTPYLPLPKYFQSERSYAQYRIPVQSAHISLSQTSSMRAPPSDVDEERCVVGWIEAPGTEEGGWVEHQLVALTYAGGWYRLLLPQDVNKVYVLKDTESQVHRMSPMKM
ncbi:hypothetical protein FB45DRAFT_1138370 [Roridomyces roridus]|uniref:Uncharacterized protein n=1 Tax=Roridomyces roridus TaxID=1738132 RepID=A0AAD7C1H1_9AGAR|nr:hypothetical protein FB45DRAFT_1138370 [Roridomyces roridus]